jgi:hypothetical protein
MTTLLLRRASASRRSGSWQHDDFDVFDGDQCVGRIFPQAHGAWFWGVSFMLTGRKSYGDANSLDGAKVAFRAEYEKWKASR